MHWSGSQRTLKAKNLKWQSTIVSRWENYKLLSPTGLHGRSTILLFSVYSSTLEDVVSDSGNGLIGFVDDHGIYNSFDPNTTDGEKLNHSTKRQFGEYNNMDGE